MRFMTLCMVAVLGLTLIGCPPKTGAKTSKTGKTVDKTGAPAAAKEITMADRVKDLKVGDWFEFAMTSGPTKMTLKYVVKSKNDDELVYTTETKMPNMPAMKPTEAKLPLKAPKTTAKPNPKAPKPKMSKETIEIGGKKWECQVCETESGGKKMKSWMANNLPWPVKTMTDGKVTMELKKCGSK